MESVVIEKPNLVRIDRSDSSPGPASDEVVVRVMASGICGTDVHIYRGEYLGGYPIVPGHEFSGVVESVGALVRRVKVGDRVAIEPNISCENCSACRSNRQNFCENWQAVGVTRPGAMAQLVVAPERVVFDIADIDFDQAAFMEPLSCVVHGIENVGIELGDRVAVIGTGPIGMLLIRTARAWGASRFAVADLSEQRLSAARDEGVQEATADLASLPSDSFDVVIDATGAPPILAEAVRLARYGGRILMFGVAPEGKTATVEPFQIFRKGLSIYTAYTSRRNSYQALELIASGRVRVADLISHRLSLEGFEAGIRKVATGSAMKAMVFPNPELFD